MENKSTTLRGKVVVKGSIPTYIYADVAKLVAALDLESSGSLHESSSLSIRILRDFILNPCFILSPLYNLYRSDICWCSSTGRATDL